MKNVFVNNLHLETHTEFRADGDIHIYPCEFEIGQQIVDGATTVSQKGRMVTEDDGTSHFRHYRKDSGPRYTPLMTTEHGEVKASKKDIIIRFAFPKHLTFQQMINLLRREVREIEQRPLSIFPMGESLFGKNR